MEQSLENKPIFKNRLINFYNLNKLKIISFIIILVIVMISFIFVKHYNEKNNILIAEKYIEAGLSLRSENREEAKKIYQEIILSKNKFYSILALNNIIEKNLIADKEKILEYFNILEKSAFSKNQKDLIILKKALYLIKHSDVQMGENLLQELIDKDSHIRKLAEDLLIN
tara:strand:- start:98 stop:607 length:510 start_codon:yes stop_codon:yes gene_type:complete